jgi:hypothetical protein
MLATTRIEWQDAVPTTRIDLTEIDEFDLAFGGPAPAGAGAVAGPELAYAGMTDERGRPLGLAYVASEHLL